MDRHYGTFRIGTSGFHYNHWKSVFYPEDLPKTQWLSYYAKHFDTVELNNTFYRLPSASTFDAWKEQAPENFCYALKFNRYGSHLLRLKRPRPTIGKFLGVAKRLGEFLGACLSTATASLERQYSAARKFPCRRTACRSLGR
jgi:uncharacterized protein YecE (DUF72 family)